MKRDFIIRIIVAILFSVIVCSAVAEDNKSMKWGLKVSSDIELPGKWHGENVVVNMFKPGYGFSLGCISRINIIKNFYFEPEISLFYSQYSYKGLVIPGDNDHPSETDPKLYKWGIQIPLVFGYSFNFPFHVFTGPQIRYAFAGGIDIKNKILIEGMEDDFDLWGSYGQRRFDCSWIIGVGLPIKSWAISLEADLGISDLSKGGMTFRENRLSLEFKYYFK